MEILTNDDPLPYQEARTKFLQELYSNDADIRAEYIKAFGPAIERFVNLTAGAVAAWRPMDSGSAGTEHAYVTALANLAIYLHVNSMKLFITGHTVAAGAVYRQVLETIALTLLCSNHQLPYLKDFIAGKYKTHRAIPDVMAHALELGVKPEALTAIKKSQKWYHQYSHPTRLTLAIPMVVGGDGDSYVGTSFDPGKLEQYGAEMHLRLGLSSVLVSFIEAVKANVARWPEVSAASRAPAR